MHTHTHAINNNALKKLTQMRRRLPSLCAYLLSQPLAQISSTLQLQIDAGGLMTTTTTSMMRLAVWVLLGWWFWQLREGDRWHHRHPIGLERPRMESAWRYRLGNGRLLLSMWGEGERCPWHEGTPYPVASMSVRGWGCTWSGQKKTEKSLTMDAIFKTPFQQMASICEKHQYCYQVTIHLSKHNYRLAWQLNWAKLFIAHDCC